MERGEWRAGTQDEPLDAQREIVADEMSNPPSDQVAPPDATQCEPPEARRREDRRRTVAPALQVVSLALLLAVVLAISASTATSRQRRPHASQATGNTTTVAGIDISGGFATPAATFAARRLDRFPPPAAPARPARLWDHRTPGERAAPIRCEWTVSMAQQRLA